VIGAHNCCWKYLIGAISTHGEAKRSLEVLGGDKDRQVHTLWKETKIGEILPWDDIDSEDDIQFQKIAGFARENSFVSKEIAGFARENSFVSNLQLQKSAPCTDIHGTQGSQVQILYHKLVPWYKFSVPRYKSLKFLTKTQRLALSCGHVTMGLYLQSCSLGK